MGCNLKFRNYISFIIFSGKQIQCGNYFFLKMQIVNRGYLRLLLTKIKPRISKLVAANQVHRLIYMISNLCVCVELFLNCGTRLLVIIRMNAFKLQSVNIDLFLDLFIFIQEKACSQMYVDPNSGKSLTAKFFIVKTPHLAK